MTKASAWWTIGLVSLSMLGVIPAAHARNLAAEGFAQRLIDEGLSILRGDAVGPARRERFRAFITPHVEARKTALFTLGVYRRGASQQVLDDFAAVFRDYTIAIYEVRLDQYRHATMTVVGSIDATARDVIVNTRGDDPRLREPVSIGFRLTAVQDTFKIVDVQVAGIWLSVEQREQFTALLGQNGGNVTALTDELRKRTARIRAGVSDP
jgi:phospholipid transport system substrate-binding protein